MQVELRLIIVLFISRFRVTAPPELGATTVAELQATATSYIALSLERGLPLKFEPRSMCTNPSNR